MIPGESFPTYGEWALFVIALCMIYVSARFHRGGDK